MCPWRVPPSVSRLSNFVKWWYISPDEQKDVGVTLDFRYLIRNWAEMRMSHCYVRCMDLVFVVWYCIALCYGGKQVSFMSIQLFDYKNFGMPPLGVHRASTRSQSIRETFSVYMMCIRETFSVYMGLSK